MTSLTLEVQEKLAEKLAGIDREVLLKALEAGLELRNEQIGRASCRERV